MARLAVLMTLPLAGPLAGCDDVAARLPTQESGRVVAAFADAIAGCSSALTGDGDIDEVAIATVGWTVTARSARHLGETRTLALDDRQTGLRPGEYEASAWRHARHTGDMELIRHGRQTPPMLYDTCYMTARVDGDSALAAVLAGLTSRFGRPPDRSGVVPRGGDFLTPRSDPPQQGHYWAMPRHDIYLQTADGGYASVEIVAMPDRDALDRHSPDRPEHRLIIPSGEPTT